MSITVKLASGYEVVIVDESTDSVTIFQRDTYVPLVKAYIMDGKITVRWNETVIKKPELKPGFFTGVNVIELPFEP